MFSFQSLVASIPTKVRAFIFAAGAVVWVLGPVAALWSVEVGIFMFLLAMGMMHLSDFGRPVVINVFTEADQEVPATSTITSAAGYL